MLVSGAGRAHGDRAQLSDWPAGPDDTRYEVRIEDGLGATLGYAYLYTAPAPSAPSDPNDYVDLAFAPVDETLEWHPRARPTRPREAIVRQVTDPSASGSCAAEATPVPCPCFPRER